MEADPVNPFDLTGRVAIVTGAGSPTGIGMATASLLAGLGAAVLVTSTTGRVQDRAAELRAAGRDAVGVAADLTDEAAAQRVVDAAVHRWGRLDILVNNAGMTSVSDPTAPGDRLQEMSLATWHAGLQRNLDTAFLVTRAAVPAMTSGRGRIVMVASVTGPLMAMRGEPVYGAAKAAMVGLARSLARRPGTRGHHGQRGGAGVGVHRLADAARARAGAADAAGPQRHAAGGGCGGRLPRLARGVLRHRAVPGRRRRQHGRRGACLSGDADRSGDLRLCTARPDRGRLATPYR